MYSGVFVLNFFIRSLSELVFYRRRLEWTTGLFGLFPPLSFFFLFHFLLPFALFLFIVRFLVVFLLYPHQRYRNNQFDVMNQQPQQLELTVQLQARII